jgi:hypothetical protein
MYATKVSYLLSATLIGLIGLNGCAPPKAGHQSGASSKLVYSRPSRGSHTSQKSERAVADSRPLPQSPGPSLQAKSHRYGSSSGPSYRRHRTRHHKRVEKAPRPHERPGLATTAGEFRYSPVQRESFVRSHPTRPWAAVAVRYNNLAGVYAQIKDRVRYTRCAHCAGGYRLYCVGSKCPLIAQIPVRRGVEVWLEDARGRRLSGVNIAGRSYVVGRRNQRYTLVIHNKSLDRFEVVASVDGLDVITRGPASLKRRGYILDARATLRIDGFRVDQRRVAAFRFGGVSKSLAAQTYGARNVGVIGVAVFAEKKHSLANEARLRETANPFPFSNHHISP